MTLRRVGVNLLWLRPGQVGGTETYIRRVLQAIAISDPDCAFTLFGTDDAIDAVAPTDSGYLGIELSGRLSNPIARVAAERTWLPRRLPRELDVMHHPGGTLPFASGPPSVVTVHDLLPLLDRQNFSLAKQLFLRRAIPSATERASVVTTPSEWVKEQVCERFGVAEDRVITVSAFAPARTHRPDAEPSDRVASLLARGAVVFYPAMTLRHKNHAMLFDAFKRALVHRPELQLICVGAVGRDDAEICALAVETSPHIHMLGHVSGLDLDALFEGADVLAFPSRHEGFGLPILEAHQVGLPVIASNAGAIPEVAGGAAVLLDPEDGAAWTEALRTPIEGPARARIVTAGAQNVLRYSASATAAQQLRAYERATSLALPR